MERKSNITHACEYVAVFCTKYRRPVLVPPVSGRLVQLIEAGCSAADASLVGLEVQADHVRMIVRCSPQPGIHRLVTSLKRQSAGVLRREFPALKTRIPCLWTNSYFAATVGAVPLDAIARYVAAQKHT